jgi:hypothetical protein
MVFSNYVQCSVCSHVYKAYDLQPRILDVIIISKG